jgi:hypothetical protein
MAAKFPEAKAFSKVVESLLDWVCSPLSALQVPTLETFAGLCLVVAWADVVITGAKDRASPTTTTPTDDLARRQLILHTSVRPESAAGRA